MAVKDRDHLVAWLRAEAEEGDDDAEPVAILKSDLSLLQCSDIPMGLSLQVLEKPDDGTRRYPALDGTITRLRGSRLVADIGQYAWRKSWPVSLGIEQYHDLVRAAVELRSRRQGDVKVVERVDDNVYGFYFRIDLPWGNLHRAFAHAVTVHSELLETAEAIRVGIDDLIATAFKRLEGWGAEPLDALVERMWMGNAQDKGRTLEELASRSFNTAPGFQATGHVYT